jgi:aspartyl-tRNA(Asn)/glutamyl-tRNA(Gln) amidotransferase subunit A
MARAGAFAITASEGANLHIENLRSRPEMFDPAIRDRLLAGALLPADLVLQAQRFRRRFQAAARGVFAEFDVLLAPATPCPALAVGQRTLDIGGVEMLARAHIGVYTQPLSYIGLPIIVVPVPMADGLPIGVQVVAAPWAEDKAFRIAAFLERQGAVASPVAVP